MKISKIKISKFHQFEDFELDLTYPKGHEKAGKPLDKVCFIGQSGTGKTTLLEMIELLCDASHHGGFAINPDYETQLNLGQKKLIKFVLNKEQESVDVVVSLREQPIEGMSRLISSGIVRRLLYFPAGLTNVNISEIVAGKNANPSHDSGFDEEQFNTKQDEFYHNPHLRFNTITLKYIWEDIYQEVKKHQSKEADFRIGLTNKIEESTSEIDIKKQLLKWKKENPNPLELIAEECLDTLLNRFHLSVKTKIDSIREINALQIISKNEGVTIPYGKLSTGIKQIIFTAFPIYQLLEDDSIVLMDEPETSLYPDIQREIIPYYTSFDKTKTSQFFFATHSPIIASAFEPWEIVELKFDEKGKVYRDKYYEGENHVDNYKIDPRYLRWDDILTKVFDMEVDSNAEFRAAKLTEYAILKDKVKSWKEAGKLAKPTKAIQAEVAKFEKMYDLLTGNWAVTRHEKN